MNNKIIWSSNKKFPIVGKGWSNQFYNKETKQLFTYRIDSTMRLTKKARKEFYEKTGIRLTTDGRMSRSQPNSITHAYTVAESRRIRHQKLTIKYGLLNE